MTQNRVLTPLQKCNMVTPTIELLKMLFLTLLAVYINHRQKSLLILFRQTTFKILTQTHDHPTHRTLKNALFGLISRGEDKTRNGM